VWQNEITLWTDVVEKSPGLVRGHVNLGNAYSKAGKFNEAEMYLARAIELDPADGHSYESLGTNLEKQLRYNEAIDAYNQALSGKRVDKAKLHSNLSIVFFKIGNYRATIEHARQSIKLNPYRYNPYVTLGSAYFKIRAFKQAEEIFLKAIQLFPEKGDSYVGLATVYEHQNKLTQAVSVIQKALTTKEVNQARAYNNLGIVYWRQGNLQKSVTAAQKAIELDPELLDAYLTLGITYEGMGQGDLAFAQFRKAWQKGLDMVGTYNEWAINFIRTNTPDKAIFYLQEAIKLDPSRPASHKNLSTAYQMKGMLQEAETHRQLFKQYENP
jgi:tetratricopeptide (TPR) repeat protein